MKAPFNREKRQKFSFRKLTIGFLSVAIASLFVGFSDGPAQIVSADQLTSSTKALKTISYHYVTDSELTKKEYDQIIKGFPSQIEENDTDYYFIYKPQEKIVSDSQNKTLPKTGQQTSDFSTLIASGLILVAIVIIKKKRKKEVIVSLLLLTAGGITMSSQEVLALKNDVLSQFNQTFQIESTQFLPKPVTINGYDYIGYFKIPKDNTKDVEIDSSTSSNIVKVPETAPRQADPKEARVESRLETTTSTIPFTEETQNSDELFVGESKVIQEGVTGQRTITTKIDTIDGSVISTEEISNEVSQSPVNRIVAIGTKIKESNVPETAPTQPDSKEARVESRLETTTSIIPFTEETQDSEELFVGESKVIQEGVTGQRTITTKIDTIDGSVISTEEISNEISQSPVNRIVAIGTKVKESKVPETAPTQPDSKEARVESRLETTTSTIPFTEETQDSDELFVGESKVIQEGVTGQRTITTKIDTIDGSVISTEEISNEISQSPVNRIVAIGTKVKESKVPEAAPRQADNVAEVIYKIETEIEDIDFNHVVVNDADKYEDEEADIRPGVKGKREIVRRIHLIDGQTIKTEEISSTQTLAPVDQITTIGIKVDKRQLQAEYDDKDIVKQDLLYRLAENFKKNAYDQALSNAYAVLNDKEANKTNVKKALDDLKSARQALDGQLKSVPTLAIKTITKNEERKEATVTFTLNDQDQASLSSKLYLYHDSNLLREIEITNINDSLTLSNLDYYTDYTIKTELQYNIGNGNITKLSDNTETFRLDYKKIEFKDVDEIEIYEKEEQNFKRLMSFAEKPTQLDNFFIKIKSDRFKEKLLPISDISEDPSHPNAYKVSVMFDELVQDKQMAEDTQYQSGFHFFVAKSQRNDAVYTDFKDLIAAIKNNPSGSYTIGANLTASDINVSQNDISYVDEFSGTLTAEYNGNKYAIYDLRKPLFNTLKKATITHLDLKNVSIEAVTSELGSLANTVSNSHLEDIAATGHITGSNVVGGIIGAGIENSTIQNVSFEGTVNSSANWQTGYMAGGIAGRLNKASLRAASTNVTLNLPTTGQTHRGGGLVGLMDNNARLSNAIARGKINYSGNSQVGGIVGSTWVNGQVNDVISDIDVQNGNLIHGDTAHNNANIRQAYAVTTDNKGRADKWTTQITFADIANKLTNYHITATITDSKNPLERHENLDYTVLKNAVSERSTAYYNVEKLVPFYNKEWIIYQGNKISTSDKLYQTKLLDVVPMKDSEVIIAIANQKNAINKLMLHYVDGTIDYLPLNVIGQFKNTDIFEYQIANTDLIYTPEEFISDYTDVINQVLPELNTVVFSEESLKTTLKMTDNDKLYELFLEESFADVKSNLANQIRKILTMNQSINTKGKSVKDYLISTIKENKEAILLGLAYMNRWYDINYDDLNTKDLTAFKHDFFGSQDSNSLDVIINIGKSGFEQLKGKNTVLTYSKLLAYPKQQNTLFNLLETYRQLFLPNKSNSRWFKDNSKAYIVETLSDIPEVRSKQETATRDDKFAIGLYDKLTQNSWSFKNMILPLLTMKEESLYIISTLSTISFGGYERYLYNNETPNGEDYKTYMHKLVDTTAKWHRDHFDFWYKILSPESREKLANSILNYDGFNYRNNATQSSWRTLESKDASIRDFFGPVGKWYINNGAGAYATGHDVSFIYYRILDRNGASTMTHEMVHNFDGNIYFEGNGRRTGLGAELFALGLLQAPDNIDEATITINHIFNDYPDSDTRMHTISPKTRFKNADDLQQYIRGMFDVVYSLEYLEAQSVLKATPEVKKEWYRTIENYYVTDEKTGKETHAGNTVRALTDEEVAKLTDFNSLIDNNILNRRDYREGKRGRNGYYTTSLHSPIYAALDNKNGAPGDVMFRRIAFELLAEKGYQNGFIPYVSNQLGDVATAENSLTWSSWFNRNVPLITDQHVLQHIFNGKYESWAAFKKAMYQERIDKLQTLKPITIQYELGNPQSTKTITISSLSQLQELMDAAAQKDFDNLPRATNHTPASWVNLLKKKIYNAYLRETDEFRESIFN
ncbi:ZmpA/ZmpB/ZmpC family metallo-endopeptidase [Streptococcus sp. CSL10205-OR2]|uniref:ZmpA/ZmpB/ZmpC family metallo-endopeptidase n=1 Tax=Streptococcus sp. CSL10205-OR2 TaxID=2980558 RepID=UPI0021D93378|nr:ZmpA/ZmpB/ZmpC family metallo-endopeptidase [Streptococcus sp. CSL10205-OR2]MCU9533707.1 G5 domain-containing protein [Streptococcus sp. CSL10205-OR2]